MKIQSRLARLERLALAQHVPECEDTSDVVEALLKSLLECGYEVVQQGNESMHNAVCRTLGVASKEFDDKLREDLDTRCQNQRNVSRYNRGIAGTRPHRVGRRR